MVTDVNLNKLFIGEKEETPVNGILPEAEGQQQDKTEEESGRSVRGPSKLKALLAVNIIGTIFDF